jgi:hypothetical protein
MSLGKFSAINNEPAILEKLILLNSYPWLRRFFGWMIAKICHFLPKICKLNPGDGQNG